jgi:hypothetical protein
MLLRLALTVTVGAVFISPIIIEGKDGNRKSR